jgi:hypothetical protein
MFFSKGTRCRQGNKGAGEKRKEKRRGQGAALEDLLLLQDLYKHIQALPSRKPVN